MTLSYNTIVDRNYHVQYMAVPKAIQMTNMSTCRECSGSLVECLTRDCEAAGSSLYSVTALWSLSKTHLS